MNTLSVTTRRRVLSLTTHVRRKHTNPRRKHTDPSTQSSSFLSNSKNPKTPKQHKPKWTLSPPVPFAPTQNPQNPNGDYNYTTLSNLLKDPSLPPGPPLEDALNQSGIEPDQALLEQIFSRFDSSPKPLFTLFLWAEKQPWYKFSVVVFNAMVNALGKARDFDSAWCLILDRINSVETRPGLDTFAIMIRRYARAGMPLPAIRTYEFASSLDFIHESDPLQKLFVILLDSLCKEGRVREASEFFDKQRKENPSLVAPTQIYNILLNGWFRSRKLKRAEQLWLEMRRENVRPTVVTYGTLVEGLCRMCRVEMAIDLIDEMRSEGVEPNAMVYNPIIDALGEAGRFKEALGLMERFLILESGPTNSTYNSLVKGFCKAGDLEGAGKILKIMIDRGFLPIPTTYNYFFKYFSKFGKIEEGLNLYTKMVESGYVPDRLTYHLLVKMLCEGGRLDLAMQISKEMRARGYDLDLPTCTMLIHLLCKMHRLDEAFREFEDMTRRGIVPQYLTYQKLCNKLKKQGMAGKVQELYAMLASLRHSTKLPNTFIGDGDVSHARETSVLQKAEAVSNFLKTCRNPRELVKRRNPLENAISSANRLMDSIKRKINSP